MGERYSLWGRSGFPGPLRATHRRRCVPFLFTTGCSVKVGSSISVSFWLRMPGHRGAGSRSRNGMFCVPRASRTCAVAPCLLCEDLAVILVLGGGCGASAHPCEASASGLWSHGSSPPSTGSVVAVLVLGCPVLLAWTYHCFSLGAWSLDLPSSSVACHPSPSHGLARLGGFVCVSTFWNVVCIISWKYRISFLRNLSFRLRWRLIPSLPRAPSIFMPGLIRKRGWECWSGSSSTSLHGS